MKRLLAFSAITVAFGVAACVVAPGEPGTSNNGQTVDPLSCPAGTTFFNGECHASCDTTASCATGTRCMRISSTDNACLEESLGCAYLGSDTQCYGVGGYYSYSGRGGTSTWIPYESSPEGAYGEDTPYVDDYFQVYTGSYYTDARGNTACHGDAEWIDVAQNAKDGLSCAGEHDVKRCRMRGRTCQLVEGRTLEVVVP